MANEIANASSEATRSSEGKLTFPPNYIRVSGAQPMHFYVRLAKKKLLVHDEVEITGLGLGIIPTVKVVEFLKRDGYIAPPRIETSLQVFHPPNAQNEDAMDRKPSDVAPKAKVQICIEKSIEFYPLVEES